MKIQHNVMLAGSCIEGSRVTSHEHSTWRGDWKKEAEAVGFNQRGCHRLSSPSDITVQSTAKFVNALESRIPHERFSTRNWFGVGIKVPYQSTPQQSDDDDNVSNMSSKSDETENSGAQNFNIWIQQRMLQWTDENYRNCRGAVKYSIDRLQVTTGTIGGTHEINLLKTTRLIWRQTASPCWHCLLVMCAIVMFDFVEVSPLLTSCEKFWQWGFSVEQEHKLSPLQLVVRSRIYVVATRLDRQMFCSPNVLVSSTKSM